MQSGRHVKPRSPIKARSAKRARLMRTERVPLVKEMLADDPPCEFGRRVTSGDYIGAVVLSFCRGRADCIHERRKRSQQGSMTKRANLVPLCWWCNQAIESDADIARFAHEVGLVVKRGDPGWAELGADRD